MQAWNVLLRDHHSGYISWAEFEENQQTLSENAHMQKRTSRKGVRGGRALLTGLVRCGRCARMMRIFYGSQASHANRYQCIGELSSNGICLGIGGVRVDQAIARELLEAVSDCAVKAAILAEALCARTGGYTTGSLSRAGRIAIRSLASLSALCGCRSCQSPGGTRARFSLERRPGARSSAPG